MFEVKLKFFAFIICIIKRIETMNIFASEMACPITIEIGIKDNSKIIILFSKFLIMKITDSYK